ncbi:MAG: TniQ family protein, partial [Xanthomonadales bacterium]|nr:TniQ family protein [Xanthomonadales bacterium]
MKFRPWTFRLKPLPDELLSSWLTRVAFAHGQNPYVFHNLHLPGVPIWSRDVDRAHSPGLLSGLSAVSGLSVPRIRATSLDRHRNLGLNTPAHGEWPFVLSAGIYHRKRRRHGLQFCPNCLSAGTAYFRRSWRLAYVLKCPTCSLPLSDACPHCDAPVIAHRTLSDLRVCHRCGGNICSDAVRAENALEFADGGMQ